MTLFRDQAGSVSIMAASTLVLAMVIVALVVDIGSMLLTRRNLQAAADMAALAAVRAPTRARGIAEQAMADNGFAAGNARTVTVGSYTLDLARPAASRFLAGGTGQPEAVEVVAEAEAPLHFFRAFSTASSVPVSVRAVAVHGREAAFSAGTGLASLDAGVLNALLGSLLGSSINLSLMSYQGLITADLNLLSFLDALATDLNLSVATYDDLLDARVQFGDLLDAALAVTTDATARSALTTLRTQVHTTKTLRLGDMLDVGLWRGMGLGAGARDTSGQAKVSVFDLITVGAQVANGSNSLSVPLSVSLPGIASVSLALTMIERPRIAIGPEGTAIHTAQTRLQLNAQLLPLKIGLVNASVVNLPIYIEVADGDAYIDDISCGTTPLNDGMLTVRARSGIASAYIGSVGSSAMSNFAQPVTVADADIINVLGILKVTGSASATAGSTTYAPLVFTAADVAAGTTKRVSSGLSLSNLIATLIGNLQLDVSLLGSSLLSGLLGLTTGLVKAVVAPVLTAALGTLEPVIDSVLQALGVNLGYMDVTARGMRCGAVALVQ